MREEPYMADIICKYGLRVIVGKGGMGEATRRACKECGCVYLQAVGGAGRLLAQAVQDVTSVHFEKEFGPAEAVYEFVVRDLEAIVSMDTRGSSLHKRVSLASGKALRELL
jgi:fumarate hydratase class I